MKLISIIIAVVANDNVIIFAPFLNFKIKCKIKYKMVNNKGINAGKRMKLSIALPSIKAKKDLCAPHPGQSIPN
jgi:hypothetical protein